MNLYHMSTQDDEIGMLVFADSSTEARKIIRTYYKDIDEVCGHIRFTEEAEVKKGIIGEIDWTEPDLPLLRGHELYETNN